MIFHSSIAVSVIKGGIESSPPGLCWGHTLYWQQCTRGGELRVIYGLFLSYKSSYTQYLYFDLILTLEGMPATDKNQRLNLIDFLLELEELSAKFSYQV